jgi:hypothetical protein
VIGHEDDHRRRRPRFDAMSELESLHSGRRVGDEHDIGLATLDHFEGFGCGGDGFDCNRFKEGDQPVG